MSAGILRVLGSEIAELPLVATSREHQGQVSGCHLSAFLLSESLVTCIFDNFLTTNLGQ